MSAPAATEKERTLHCTYHCSSCGSHFRSLSAFDAHRVGTHQKGKHCVDPAMAVRGKGKDRRGALEVATHEGVCKMYADPALNVTIWMDAVEYPSSP